MTTFDKLGSVGKCDFGARAVKANGGESKIIFADRPICITTQ